MPNVDDYTLTLMDRRQPHSWRVRDRIGAEDALGILEKRMRQAKQLTQGLAKCVVSRTGRRRQVSDPPDPALRLRAQRERPRSSYATQDQNQRAAPHSITSSARASRIGGSSILSSLAVLMLMTNSSLLACSTGKSAGLAPLRIRSVKYAMRRAESKMLGP